VVAWFAVVLLSRERRLVQCRKSRERVRAATDDDDGGRLVVETYGVVHY
jgi:hypothetical protein